MALMEMHTNSIYAIMKFAKYGLVMHVFAPCLAKFIMADGEVIYICINTEYFCKKAEFLLEMYVI